MSWAVASQAPLSVEFSRKNTGVGCHIWYTKVNSDSCEGYMESDKRVFHFNCIYLFLIKGTLILSYFIVIYLQIVLKL